ncbi:MAG: MFS transporter [Pirellulales bacterium]
MSQSIVEEMPLELTALDRAIAEKELAVRPCEEVDRRPFFYGWVMLPLTMAALIASSPGQTFGVSILNEPMRLSIGLTHGQLAAAYMLGTLLGAVPIAFVGSLMDRYGPRKAMLAAVSLFMLACWAVASAQGWYTLVIAFFLLRTLGPGALAFLSGNTLPFWFERRLGTVEGLRQLGMAISMAVIPTMNLYLIQSWGWRGAYAFLGVGIWVILFPAVFFLFRDHPSDIGQSIDGHSPPSSGEVERTGTSISWGLTLAEALRTSTFWIVAGGTALFASIQTAIFFCLVPILHECNLSDSNAATMLTVYAASYAAMQLLGGTLADYVRASVLLCIGLIGLSISMLVLTLATSSSLAYLSGAVLGGAQGIYFGASHPLWARYFGRDHLGKIRGLLMTMIVASSSFGPLFAGIMKDWLGDFTIPLATFTLAPLPLAVLSLWVSKPFAASPTILAKRSDMVTLADKTRRRRSFRSCADSTSAIELQSQILES